MNWMIKHLARLSNGRNDALTLRIFQFFYLVIEYYSSDLQLDKEILGNYLVTLLFIVRE